MTHPDPNGLGDKKDRLPNISAQAGCDPATSFHLTTNRPMRSTLCLPSGRTRGFCALSGRHGCIGTHPKFKTRKVIPSSDAAIDSDRAFGQSVQLLVTRALRCGDQRLLS